MSDPITRLNAALEGRYLVERNVGEGGMATVYLAEDLRHERKVALKVLKPELAAVVGADRFLAEIKTTAGLQHPHILPLHDSGEADGFLYYVMPYVEGESLRQRLDREHQLPVDDAVGIATNLAEALDHAHRKGVIHRDIKPANVLMLDGKPVISDFGIAIAVGAAGGGRLTETGLSVGTPHYMSPEQATGDLGVGPASDIYALGCVLYEMLVGEPPYTGTTAQAVLGRIISGDADLVTEHRKAVPPNVEAAAARALERLAADRFTGAREFAEALRDPGFRSRQTAATAGAASPGYWKPLAIALAATTALASFGVVAVGSGPEPAPPSPVRFALGLADAGVFGQSNSGVDLALSPDGSRIYYRGINTDQATASIYQLWERSLDDLVPRPIPGTSGRQAATVSLDGEQLAFSGGGAVNILPLRGGPSVAVGPGGTNASFGVDGMVYYRVVGSGTIWRVPTTGGEPVAFTTPMEGVDLKYLDALPEPGGVLFTIYAGSLPESSIGVVGPDGGDVRELFPGAMARYAESGHILYTTIEGALMAAPFDLESLEVSGPAVAMLEGVIVKSGAASQFAISDDGTLAYIAAVEQQGQFKPVWVERDGGGREVDPQLRISGATNMELGLALSPDGERLAFSNVDGFGLDVWVKELDDGPLTKLTVDGSNNLRPNWLPDGQTLAFLSNRGDQPLSVWTRRADGSGSPQMLAAGDGEEVWEASVSKDGEWAVYRTGFGAGDIYARPAGREGQPTTLVANPDFTERNPALSPDGRWLAYSSNESGRYEIYVVPFPEGVDAARFTVSTDGGVEPLWSASGDELFYVNANNQLVSARVSGDASFVVESRDALFSTESFARSVFTHLYDVHPDGQRFLMLLLPDGGQLTDVIVVQNFFAELERRVGPGG